jgi:hypothetical protein
MARAGSGLEGISRKAAKEQRKEANHASLFSLRPSFAFFAPWRET